jgi:hypothetical protein
LYTLQAQPVLPTTSRPDGVHLQDHRSDIELLKMVGSGFHFQGSVYTGFWRNYSKPISSDLTLTLENTHAQILISFLALFIRFMGTHSWGIVRYSLHQLGAQKAVRDGMYQQQQILLRNEGSDMFFIWLASRIMWLWRGRNNVRLGRSLGLILIGVSHFVLITAAALLSSKLADTGDAEVLIWSHNCGFLADDTSNQNLTESSVLDLYRTTLVRDSLSYSRACYGNVGLHGGTCDSFPKRYLKSKQYDNQSCPFNSTICSGPGVTLDTGALNSHIHFGINTPTNQRIAYRKVITCAPIDVEKHSTIVQGQNGTGASFQLGYGDLKGSNVTTSYSDEISRESWMEYPNMKVYSLRYVQFLESNQNKVLTRL